MNQFRNEKRRTGIFSNSDFSLQMKNPSGGKGFGPLRRRVEGSREVIRIYRPKSVQFKRGAAAVTDRGQVGEIRVGMASNLFVGHCILVLRSAQTAPVAPMDQLVWLAHPVDTDFRGKRPDLPPPGPGAGSVDSDGRIADPDRSEKKIHSGWLATPDVVASTLQFRPPCASFSLSSL